MQSARARWIIVVIIIVVSEIAERICIDYTNLWLIIPEELLHSYFSSLCRLIPGRKVNLCKWIPGVQKICARKNFFQPNFFHSRPKIFEIFFSFGSRISKIENWIANISFSERSIEKTLKQKKFNSIRRTLRY